MNQIKMYVGPMFSNKTGAMLLELEKYIAKNKKVLILKPYIDDTFYNSKTKSKQKVYEVNYISDIEKLNPYSYDIIAIDQAFMIPEVDKIVLKLFKSGKTILISSLDLSSNLEPFENISKIMSFATNIEKCFSFCKEKHCEKIAHYTYKLSNAEINNSKEIFDFKNEKFYEPRCFEHHSGFTKND